MAGLGAGHAIRLRRWRASSYSARMTGAGENAMYKTAKGEEIFVIDGHTHFWDGSPANQKNIHGKQFIECFYAYHSNLSPASEKWTLDKFSKYDAKTMHDDLFVHGYDDMAI